MLANCGRGVTPWGTVLTCEENADFNFANLSAVTDPRVRALHERIGFNPRGGPAQWWRYEARFDLARKSHEPFRFCWVVEIDPFDPSYTPRKRTAMGRFKHEETNVRVSADGRVAFSMGDDSPFEYVYKFVTAGRVEDKDPNLLDDGVLYAARFDVDEDGAGSASGSHSSHGERGLTAANGFANPAEVLVNPRGAADRVSATPMDRPEDVEVNPATGAVYIALTSNDQRGLPGRLHLDPANPPAAPRGARHRASR